MTMSTVLKSKKQLKRKINRNYRYAPDIHF